MSGAYIPKTHHYSRLTVTEGEYFDLNLVPERYTGYAGPPAHRVWRAIYEENCFGLSELNSISRSQSVAADTLGKPFMGYNTESDDQCLEKRVYHKIISGR
jgi:ERO1-like protein beta